ncbi:hypothetical protein HHK36_010237 [Tetracentron sinense]|uniref:AB hydrolase-1 domain-containing protein n=1 Tax=Tetracentron sinense TaxID=13715 RepID=A0A835DIA4_TETSI|nr:hypothetical protein HHK36_010237 [Tetracentron sinense]
MLYCHAPHTAHPDTPGRVSDGQQRKPEDPILQICCNDARLNMVVLGFVGVDDLLCSFLKAFMKEESLVHPSTTQSKLAIFRLRSTIAVTVVAISICAAFHSNGMKQRWSSSFARMAEEISKTEAESVATSGSRWAWPSLLRWIPTSTDHIIAAEKRLLSIIQTPYVQEQVNIGSGPPGSKVRWFRSSSNEPRFINTVTFDSKDDSPTLVMVHGYGASQGFFFRNFDILANRFRVIAIDQLGWGGSSRPDFTCKSTEETEAWFIDSFEEWRKAKNLSNFILLGHSFGGYVAAKYALKHPEHIQHLILVGPAGFSSESDGKSEWLTRFRATWKGAVLNHLWESNFTPQKLVRCIEGKAYLQRLMEGSGNGKSKEDDWRAATGDGIGVGDGLATGSVVKHRDEILPQIRSDRRRWTSGGGSNELD